jgi:hypothetical protein
VTTMEPVTACAADQADAHDLCRRARRQSTAATFTSVLGFGMASLVSVCCLGSAALIAMGVSVGGISVHAISSELQPYESLLAIVAALFISSSLVLAVLSSRSASMCALVSGHFRPAWLLIALAVVLLLISYSFEWLL